MIIYHTYAQNMSEYIDDNILFEFLSEQIGKVSHTSKKTKVDYTFNKLCLILYEIVALIVRNSRTNCTE